MTEAGEAAWDPVTMPAVLGESAGEDAFEPVAGSAMAAVDDAASPGPCLLGLWDDPDVLFFFLRFGVSGGSLLMPLPLNM